MGDIDQLTRLQQLLGSLAEISTSAQDTEHLLRQVMAETMRFTGASGAVVERVVGDELEYVSAAGSIAPQAGLRMPLRGSLSCVAIQAREIQCCDDTEIDPRVDREACRRVGIRSMLIVPLLFRDEVIGVLKATSEQPAAFGTGEARALELSAGIIGAVLGRQAMPETGMREGVAPQVTSEERPHAAPTDALTGLPNRRAFEMRLGEALHRWEGSTGHMALLFVDINGFKSINENLGHQVGDLALCKVGEIMVRTLRSGDIVSRLAGDEFVALLLDLDGGRQQVEWLCQKLLGALAQPQGLGAGLNLSLSVAIGVALHDDPSLTRAEWLKRADRAMCLARRQPGSAYAVYEQRHTSGVGQR